MTSIIAGSYRTMAGDILVISKSREYHIHLSDHNPKHPLCAWGNISNIKMIDPDIYMFDLYGTDSDLVIFPKKDRILTGLTIHIMGNRKIISVYGSLFLSCEPIQILHTPQSFDCGSGSE